MNGALIARVATRHPVRAKPFDKMLSLDLKKKTVEYSLLQNDNVLGEHLGSNKQDMQIMTVNGSLVYRYLAFR